MSEPYWSALGGGVVDYEGAWAAGTQYAPGDVVRYNGVDYLAVNPSLGVNPGVATGLGGAPLVTGLPGSPVDGQEVTLVDSLTVPTYSWRFRYVAAKASNKWVFVGGSSLVAEVATLAAYAASTYGDIAGGPAITIPVAGEFMVTVGALFTRNAGTIGAGHVSYAIGAGAASDTTAFVVNHFQASVDYQGGGSRTSKAVVPAAGTVITAKYRNHYAENYNYSGRHISAVPIAVGG